MARLRDDGGMIRTVVLAAGLGTRLQPLTFELAKPAVPLAGKALVVRVLEWLHREGVRDVVMNLHHLPTTVTRMVGDGSHLGLTVRYSWERRILGSAGGPRLAMSLWPQLVDPFLVVNGDTLTDVAIAPLVDAHAAARKDGALATLAVVRNTRPDHYNGLRLAADGRVLAFVPKGHTEETWHFVGIQVIEPTTLQGLTPGASGETVAGIYRDLVANNPGAIRAWKVDAPFLDVGTPDDYLDAALQLASLDGVEVESVIERPWLTDSQPARIDPSAHLTNCVVWPDATIEADVVLERCVVMSGVTVPAGTTAARVVLGG